MPSARQIEIDEPLEVQTDERRADLQSLLREIHASHVSNLVSLHSRGKVLFAESEPARGVYILRSGSATVSISSSEGRIVILRIAQVGDVLGLNAVLQSTPYEATVETLEPSRTEFISRGELLELMQRSQPTMQAISMILSRELTELTDRAKSLLLPQTVSARLAKLLLEWCNGYELNGSSAVRIDRVFTQEEIARMICSSRETVTRLLAMLSRRRIIGITSDSILITDRSALEAMAIG
jgi:CRP-like cAMP-binding protein